MPKTIQITRQNDSNCNEAPSVTQGTRLTTQTKLTSGPKNDNPGRNKIPDSLPQIHNAMRIHNELNFQSKYDTAPHDSTPVCRALPRPRNAGAPLPENTGGSARERRLDPPPPLADPEDALYLEPRKVVKVEEATDYANLNPDISSFQAEGILNRLIDSVAAQKLFLSVPVQREEMYNCNKYPENLLKNWSKTLLPYDKTRVVLSPLFKLASSDYINASHVKGFGGSLRYVAAQGPLEHTVTDFWRMAWELRVSVIIMLAKFDETSEMYPQCQLATYLRVGPPLKGNGYTITALRSRLEKNFSVTTVKIEHDGSTRTLEHYHHSGWDKNTLDVPRNLAAMLQCFLTRHNEGLGEVVIHCTDGLRRTSVVLLALLMMESILSEGCLRIKEALSKVRKCRPGMVSKQEDFNLALEIVDELLHGTATACVADDFNRNLSKKSQSSQALFRKAHVLESISVSEAAQRYPACLALHRFPSIIPLDTRRVVLQSEDQVADENLHDADRHKEEHDKEGLQQEKGAV
nr:receptor-type tyrosine-protein phosphatase S-like [Penaeus vannamei]